MAILFCIISQVIISCLIDQLGLSSGSASKEFACKSRGPGLIPRSGRYPGEGIGYPLQYSWASQASQLVKNQPAM